MGGLLQVCAIYGKLERLNKKKICCNLQYFLGSKKEQDSIYVHSIACGEHVDMPPALCAVDHSSVHS
jgi:hypothetical protein